MTHKGLVNAAADWLKNSKHCTVVIKELKTWNTETPDVIGFWAGGRSIMIECKTSRNDFLADKQKMFRKYSEMGMGDERYFFAEKGIIEEVDLPQGWGLLKVIQNPIHETKRQVRMIKESNLHTANKNAELTMIISVLRRLEIAATVFVRQEDSAFSGMDLGAEQDRTVIKLINNDDIKKITEVL